MTGVRLSDDWNDDGWTRVPRNILRDERMSFKAKGLVAWLASHKPGFRITRAFIAQAGTDGKEAVESGLRELRELGYLTVEQARDATGRLGAGADYVLHRQPITPVSRTTGNPEGGKPAAKRDPSLGRPSSSSALRAAVPSAAPPAGGATSHGEQLWQQYRDDPWYPDDPYRDIAERLENLLGDEVDAATLNAVTAMAEHGRHPKQIINAALASDAA